MLFGPLEISPADVYKRQLLGSAFSLYALKTQFQHYYSAEALLPMQGLNGILTGALMVIGALYIFLEAIAFYNYSNSHQTVSYTHLDVYKRQI